MLAPIDFAATLESSLNGARGRRTQIDDPLSLVSGDTATSQRMPTALRQAGGS